MVEGWRERLLAAADADPRSDRAISLAAKLGENSVNELRNTKKMPSVERVLKLAAELKVSITYLFLGEELTPEDEEFLRLLKRIDPAEQAVYLAALRGRQKSRS